MATVTRRKYRFPSRQAAEDRVSALERSNMLASHALRALLMGDVEWYADKACGYRVGVFDLESPSGPRLIVSWQPEGQRPSLEAHYAADWLNSIREHLGFRAGYMTDEDYALSRLFQKVSAAVRQ